MFKHESNPVAIIALIGFLIILVTVLWPVLP